MSKNRDKETASITFRFKQNEIEALYQIALKHDCLRGDKPNLSGLLRKIAIKQLDVVDPREKACGTDEATHLLYQNVMRTTLDQVARYLQGAGFVD